MMEGDYVVLSENKNMPPNLVDKFLVDKKSIFCFESSVFKIALDGSYYRRYLTW